MLHIQPRRGKPGAVKLSTPKVGKMTKRKKLQGRAYKRKIFNKKYLHYTLIIPLKTKRSPNWNSGRPEPAINNNYYYKFNIEMGKIGRAHV